MAGKSEALAVKNYIDPIRRALACVTKAVPQVGGGYSAANNPHTFTLGAEPVRLSGKNKIRLSIEQIYEIVETDDPDRGPWKVHILAYDYALYDLAGPIASYHWHPDGASPVKTPHVHFQKSGVHFPTGRIAIEDIVRFAIQDFGVKPWRRTWARILADTQGKFECYRLWG